MYVSIFGGANPQADGTSYEDAYNLGKNLALAGHVVLTGGYIGTMEAASRGAAEAGGHVIGVTCREIEQWRKVKANQWVIEERYFDTLDERLMELVKACEAAIALPGGVGTLLEISMLWNKMIVDSLPHKPLILVGDGWQRVIESFFLSHDGYVSKPSRQLIIFASDVNEAFQLLQKSQKQDL